MSDSDDDIPALSAETLAALQEFYAESRNGLDHDSVPLNKFSVGAVEEDWRMSQFWYSDDTATLLGEAVIQAAGEGGRIACLSAPSVYQKLKQGALEGSDGVSVVLLEYDRRFATYGQEFVYYDYKEPLALPPHITPQSFDIVLADPPYLSEECLSKVAQTVKFLTKAKVLLCTGAIMSTHAKDLLGLEMCTFLPKHNKNLGNDFRCYTNYPSTLLSC